MFVTHTHNGREHYMVPASVVYDPEVAGVRVVFDDNEAVTFVDGIVKVFDHGVEVRKFDLRESWLSRTWKKAFG